MKRFLLTVCLAASLACGACSTSYKTAPSTAKVAAKSAVISTHVEIAKVSADAARKRALAAEAKTRAAQTAQAGTGASIDAAIFTLEQKDYTATAQHLIAAKVSSVVVASYLEQTLDNLVSARANFDSVMANLELATKANDQLKLDAIELQGTIDKQTLDGASDHEIATRCKSWFGLGAIFYGVERLLKAGIIGILILLAVVIVLVVVGYFVGGPFGAIVLKLGGKLLGAFRKKAPA